MAQGLLGTFLEGVSWKEADIKIIGEIKGVELENLNVFHPLYNRESLIVLGDHVTLDAGTGCVHTAPGHGLEDWEACQRYGIKTLSPLDSKGVWQKSDMFCDPDLEGVPYFKGNDIVIEKLEIKDAFSKG